MNRNLKQVQEVINKHLDFLQRAYRVKGIGVFGSMARGEQVKTSDIDLLVELSEPIGFFKFIELENFLSKILKRKVNLVTKNALKSAIKDDVLKEVVYV